MKGTVVGSYRIVEVIGSGGMGTIFRAEHTLIGKAAAVKILNPPYAQNREVVNRFFNEARAATAIQHPSIVEVFDFGYLPDGAAYIVMEFLKGESLGSRLHARGTLLETEAFAIVRGIAGALGAAHARGIVHRDIKPDNVFLVPDPEMASGERVKLLDFGIAKLTEEPIGSWSQTRTGTVLGTPSYMAPEQCSGAGNVDHRADLYSLGCILFELLAGRPPFVGGGAGEIIGAHQFVPAPRLRDVAPGVSRDADELVAMLLTKRADDRVQSAADLIRLLGARGGVKATGGPSHIAVGTTGEIFSTTTLGGATGSYPAPSTIRPPRRRLGIAIGAGALAVIAGLAVIASSGSSSPPAAPFAAPADAGLAPAVAPIDAAIAAPIDAAIAAPIDAAVTKPKPRPPRKPKPGSGYVDDL